MTIEYRQIIIENVTTSISPLGFLAEYQVHDD